MRMKTAAGIGLSLSSLAFIAAGIFLVVSTVSEVDRDERAWAETEKQCVSLLKTIPGAEVAEGDDMSVVIRNVTDPRKALTDASVAVMMCPGRKMTELCVGDKCTGSQDKVVLRFKLRETK